MGRNFALPGCRRTSFLSLCDCCIRRSSGVLAPEDSRAARRDKNKKPLALFCKVLLSFCAPFVSQNHKTGAAKQRAQTGRAEVLVLSGRKFESGRRNVVECSSQAGTT